MVSMSATHRLLVADLDRDHELLHRHHVHRHEVVLQIFFVLTKATKEINDKRNKQQTKVTTTPGELVYTLVSHRHTS